jgi:hypothetical protein
VTADVLVFFGVVALFGAGYGFGHGVGADTLSLVQERAEHAEARADALRAELDSTRERLDRAEATWHALAAEMRDGTPRVVS